MIRSPEPTFLCYGQNDFLVALLCTNNSMRPEWLLLWGLSTGITALVLALIAPEPCKIYAECRESTNGNIIFQNVLTSCPIDNSGSWVCRWPMSDECPTKVSCCSDSGALLYRVGSYAFAGLAALMIMIGSAIKIQNESLHRSEEVDSA